MSVIRKGSHWDLHLQYQKETARSRPDLFDSVCDFDDYIAWLEDKFADHFATQQYAKQITDLIQK